jgi:hypothetical protein
MATAEQEAEKAARVAKASGGNDLEVFRSTYERALAERQERLSRDAHASWRAMDGWPRVTSEEDWLAVVKQASEDLDNGAFLIDRLGAQRHLDPVLAAVLLGLRRRLVEEYEVTTAAELLLVDSAVLSYSWMLRVNGWLGDMAGCLEREFFSQESLMAVLPGNRPVEVKHVRGLLVEEIVERIVDRLMPLAERANRSLLRNLAALRDGSCRVPSVRWRRAFGESDAADAAPKFSLGAFGQTGAERGV